MVALVAACGYVPEKVSLNDSRVKPMLDALAVVDRERFGFTPIEPDAVVRLESRPRSGYDAMLHVEGATSRTISFRRKDDGYEWIGEQEIHRGPRTYTTPDGIQTEEIIITREIVPLSGGSRICYLGSDPRLAGRDGLTLDDVRPILAEWKAGR
jgi:hypothetical protein